MAHHVRLGHRRLAGLALLAVASVTALTGCDWQVFRYGVSHTGFNATEHTVSVGNVSQLTTRFTATTGGALWSSPAVVGGMVYVGSYDHKLWAFDATTGAVVWTATTGSGVFSSPAVVGGIIYVGSYDGKLWAFSLP